MYFKKALIFIVHKIRFKYNNKLKYCELKLIKMHFYGSLYSSFDNHKHKNKLISETLITFEFTKHLVILTKKDAYFISSILNNSINS